MIMITVSLHEVIDVVANAYNNGKKGHIETMSLNEEDNKLLIDCFEGRDLPPVAKSVLEGNNVSIFVVGVKRLRKWFSTSIWQIENAEGKSATFYFDLHGDVKVIGGE